MEFFTSRSGRSAALKLAGDLDVEVAPALRSALLSAAAERQLLVIDMSAVTFLESTCIGVLVGAWRRFGDAGGLLVVTAVNEAVHRVLRIVRIDTILLLDRAKVPDALHDELEDFLALLASRGST